MNTKTFYLKQISCLQTPADNPAWHEIIHHSPGVSHSLVEVEPRFQSESISVHTESILTDQTNRQSQADEPIPWYPKSIDQQFGEESKPLCLRRFTYDCSYLSPFVGNLYSREPSAKGWYRWIGPNPILELRLPLAPDISENWLFTATFHAFTNEEHAECLAFEVNGHHKPLEWTGGSSYQCKLKAKDFLGTSISKGISVAIISLSIPASRQASESDQRIIAFAIRYLSLVPA
ncbi:hypothetical protein EVJ50_05610 [Synechococcus sp. RSCCF101]|uniref:hypothetical protein n=1 Tax=Synechococcus sp. RSCCF101 TaxID=2511069 RepID=UPI00124615A3|nr:hypothetical protein [Synechococcus sp. RSCCF101]QEY31802.1 hypothetical protein EVJ50_05610 [Synechococcus sp. RSCCF101]